MSIRDRMVELAAFYADTNVRDHAEGFLDLVGPDENAAMKRAMLGMSSCALTVRGLWRSLGLTHTRLSAPYVIGAAMADVMTIAKERAAWREPDGEDLPGLGDSAIVWDRSDGTDAHVFTVVALEAGQDMLRIESIDGGQRDARGERAILRCVRTWALVSPPGWRDMPVRGTAKRVRGWVDLDALFQSIG